MRRAALQCAVLCAVLVSFASCDIHRSSYTGSGGNNTTTGPMTTGTVVGTITNSAGGPLVGVNVAVTPNGSSALAAVTTSGSGGFVATGVPASPDAGSVTVSALPASCPTSTSSSYTGLTAGDTVTVNITIVCSALVGYVRGTVTSSLGGGLPGVGVVVTPHNGNALGAVLTGAGGAYVVSGIPVGDSTGSVTLTNLPANCGAPASATSYKGLAAGDTVTLATITVTCSASAGAVTGTVTSSVGGSALVGVQVTVTPGGGTALPAVTTTAAGAYTVTGVPIGAGTVTVSGLPGYCTAPSPTSYTGLTNGVTVTTNVSVQCAVATGTVSGTLTSSLSGGLGGVQVVVTPIGGTALPAVTTTGAGAYSVTHVPVGSGAVTLGTGLPAQCSAPSAVPYTGVTYNGTVTANVVATCQQMGALTVTISPGSLLLSATVTGPAGYSQTVIGTTTLTGLVPGAYTVTAAAFELPDPIVGAVYSATITGSPAQVMPSATSAVTVAYAARPGSGALWVMSPDMSNTHGAWGVLTSAQLSAGGSQTMRPTGALVPTVLSGAAVDANGTMWLVDGQTVGTFSGYATANILAATSSGTLGSPSIVDGLPYPGVYSPRGAAFDASGNLWVASTDPYDFFLGYTPTQLVSGGNLTPTYKVTHAGQLNVQGLAFDASGTLWVLNQVGLPTSLLGYTAAQLAAGGTQAPAVTIGIRESFPRGLAFDASGNLWISLFSQSKIIMLTPSQLTVSATPTPAVTLNVTNPAGIAFDASGNLWASLQSSNQIVAFPPSQLIGSGNPLPSITIPVSEPGASEPTFLVFDPHPGNVPLNGSRIVSRHPPVNASHVIRRHW